MEVREKPLAPRKCIGSIDRSLSVTVTDVSFHPVSFSFPCTYLFLPSVCHRIKHATIAIIFYQVVHGFIKPFHTPPDVIRQSGIYPRCVLTCFHGSDACCGRHPIVSRQIQVGGRKLMHELTHFGVRDFQAGFITQPEIDCRTWFYRMIFRTRYTKQRVMQPSIQFHTFT